MPEKSMYFTYEDFIRLCDEQKDWVERERRKVFFNLITTASKEQLEQFKQLLDDLVIQIRRAN